MKTRKKQSKLQARGRSLHPVVQIPNLDTYVPGKGCQCAAWSESECGCVDVDWTPKEVYVQRKRVLIATEALMRLANFITVPDRMDAVRKVARDALAEISNLNPSHQGTTHLVRRTLDGVVQFPKSQNQGE